MHTHIPAHPGSAQQRQRLRGARVPVPGPGPFVWERVLWRGVRFGDVVCRSVRADRANHLFQCGGTEWGKDGPVLLLPPLRRLLAHFVAVRCLLSSYK